MYNNPIKLTIDNFAKSIGEQVDEAIMERVKCCVSIDIDEEELKKTLAYDRRQYYYGYDDAIEDAINLIVSTESNIAKNAPYDAEWFTRMADRQHEIIELLKGMI